MRARQAWQEAIKLFWQRPVVSLPVLVAAVTPFVLTGMDSFWKRWLIPPPISNYELNRPYTGLPPFAQMLTQSLKEMWSAYWSLFLADMFIQAAVWALALFVTAGATRRLRSEEPAALLRHGWIFARSRWRDVAWLSLMGLALLFVYEAAHSAIFSFLLTYSHDRVLSGDSFADPVALMRFGLTIPYVLLWCIGACILTGMAMRCIRTDVSQGISREQVQCGKRLAIASVLLSIGLGLVLACVGETVIPNGGLNGTVAEQELHWLRAVIQALPYVWLYIALTRIVDRDEEQSI